MGIGVFGLSSFALGLTFGAMPETLATMFGLALGGSLVSLLLEE